MKNFGSHDTSSGILALRQLKQTAHIFNHRRLDCEISNLNTRYQTHSLSYLLPRRKHTKDTN